MEENEIIVIRIRRPGPKILLTFAALLLLFLWIEKDQIANAWNNRREQLVVRDYFGGTKPFP